MSHTRRIATSMPPTAAMAEHAAKAGKPCFGATPIGIRPMRGRPVSPPHATRC